MLPKTISQGNWFLNQNWRTITQYVDQECHCPINYLINLGNYDLCKTLGSDRIKDADRCWYHHINTGNCVNGQTKAHLCQCYVLPSFYHKQKTFNREETHKEVIQIQFLHVSHFSPNIKINIIYIHVIPNISSVQMRCSLLVSNFVAKFFKHYWL